MSQFESSLDKNHNKQVIYLEKDVGFHRSKFVFMLMAYFDQTINTEWHFNESLNGKRPLDRVGGNVKT